MSQKRTTHLTALHAERERSGALKSALVTAEAQRQIAEEVVVARQQLLTEARVRNEELQEQNEELDSSAMHWFMTAVVLFVITILTLLATGLINYHNRKKLEECLAKPPAQTYLLETLPTEPVTAL